MRDRPKSPAEVFFAFLKLGLTSFGGPIAHLGYFRVEFVERRRWLSEQAFVDLVALAQFLPGPASSQTGFAIGVSRAGYLGGAAAWAGFTLPSAILMALFAFWSRSLSDYSWGAGLLHGLKLVAVAIVAQAVLGMARAFCPDKLRASTAILAIAVFVALPGSLTQLAAILLGAGLGLVFAGGGAEPPAGAIEFWVSRRVAGVCIAVFFLLLGLAFLAVAGGPIALFAAFYRSGALVFGGGHVVLPLLRDAVVAPGWISDNAFLAGYGAAQAMPGPLFTFAAYLGAAASVPPGGAAGAAIALVGIFLPGILILLGTLPFWQSLRALPRARAAMQGINAAVVGLLAAALYDPVWTSAVETPVDFAIAAAAFVLLIVWRLPPIAVVIFCALAGVALH